jgi:hypothetical protein
MAYIYMDESGCLGFDFSKSKTSQHFVITFLFAAHQNRLHKIVKKTFKSFSKRDLKHHSGVLHATKEQPKTRVKLLTLLAQEEGVSIMAIRLNKKKVYTHLKDEKTVLYNYVTNILLDRIITQKLIPTNEPIHLVASRRETNKFLNDNFRAYLKQKVTGNHGVNINIQISPPAAEKGLQVVDFACWSIFRQYEHGETQYYDLIRKLVVEDKQLFG